MLNHGLFRYLDEFIKFPYPKTSGTGSDFMVQKKWGFPYIKNS